MFTAFLGKVLSSFLGTAASLLGAWLLVLWNRRRFGGWRAILVTEEALPSPGGADLGWKTAQSWLTDPWARKLGLKSLCSDYGIRLTRNVLDITVVDYSRRLFIVHFDRTGELP